MDKIKFLRDFLVNNLDIIEYSGSSGTDPDYPDFDLFPRDFLKFAKIELDKSKVIENHNTLIHVINCVSHLKRALDCQLDIFLYQLNLFDLVKKKNLKFDTKLKFLKDAGIIESTSISRLNLIRNKMEHEYKIPKVEEIEIYFDLVNAFILVIESSANNILLHYNVELESNNNEVFEYSRLGYRFDKEPKISLVVSYPDTTTDISIEVGPTEQREFVYYLRVLFLLSKISFMRKEYILEDLENNQK